MIGGGLFELMFGFVFLLVVSIIVVSLVRGISEWSRNNAAPRLDVNAVVVTKRTHVSTHYSGGDGTGAGGVHSSSTTYYVTFQVESGDRMEFTVSGKEYGMLSEQDTGKLSFQGTRYLGFARSTGMKE